MVKNFLKISIFLLLVIKNTTAFALLDYKDLYDVLVEIKGWKADSPSGSYMRGSLGEVLKAERHYQKEKKRLDVSIIAGEPAVTFWLPFKMETAYEDEEAYLKTTDIKGFRAGISHNRKDSAGSIVVLIKEIDEESGVVLVLDYLNMDDETAFSLLKLFSLEKIRNKFK